MTKTLRLQFPQSMCQAVQAMARRGSRERFEAALAKGPDVPPALEDWLDGPDG